MKYYLIISDDYLWYLISNTKKKETEKKTKIPDYEVPLNFQWSEQKEPALHKNSITVLI